MIRRGRDFCAHLDRRRSVRHFSDRAVPREMIELAIRAASTAPSGANLQPWIFVAVSDARKKHQIRVAAEPEEHQRYICARIPQEWLEPCHPLATHLHKPSLQT